MTKTLKMLLAAALVVSGAFATTGVALADIEDASGDNVQEGDNRSTARQSGRGASGDAVGGQVVGVVSGGRTSVDATNRSENVDVTTGDAEGGNAAISVVGHSTTVPEEENNIAREADIIDVPFAANLHEGDNRTSVSQSADATTGDGVGGQVAGVVTAAGGSASLALANTTLNTSVETGDAEAFNDAIALAGSSLGPPGAGPFGFCENPAGNVPGSFRNRGFCPPGLIDNPGGGNPNAADIVDSCTEEVGCANVQEGDNVVRSSQTARAASGDGVGGQVIGVVSAGATSVDATNRTVDSFVDTGDAEAANASFQFAGLTTVLPLPEVAPAVPTLSDISGVPFATNLQEGDNRLSSSQTAEATTGDAVAGQVAGVVTAAGGSASIVLANTSVGIDATTGDGEFDNENVGFVGLLGIAVPTSGVLD